MIKRRRFLTSAAGAYVLSLMPMKLLAQAVTGENLRKLPEAAAWRNWPQRQLLTENPENSMLFRSLSKPVAARRLIDDMNSDRGWTLDGSGTISYVANAGRDGDRALRLVAPTRDEAWIAKSRRPDGSFNGSSYSGMSMVTLEFSPPQDWSGFNRLSLWVRIPEHDGYGNVLQLRFLDRGAKRGGLTDLESFHSQQGLKQGEWNQIVWEIPEFKRDEVVRVQICHSLFGAVGGEDMSFTYDFDRIELQSVEAEKYEGWDVAADRISFNHVGFAPLDDKQAFSHDHGVDRFQVLDAAGGKVVGDYPATLLDGPKGSFRILDFSALRESGQYVLHYGDVTSRPFDIAEDIWLRPVEKNFNYWYAVRCGIDVPGVHPASHYDVTATHKGVTKVINGGWYDAADTVQRTSRSFDILLGMLTLYEQLDANDSQRDLRERVLEEISWGLSWALHLRFGKGVRSFGWVTRFFSDNVLDNADDVNGLLGFDASENLHFVALAAQAARLLRDSEPKLATQCLVAAREDFDATMAQQKDWSSISREDAARGVLGALELFKATGKKRYADRAETFGRLLIRCQEQSFKAGAPLTGYFYQSAERNAIAFENHESPEEVPLAAFRHLCEELPDSPDWMDWYAAATLHSEFFMQRGAEVAAPYRYLPNSLWTKNDLKHAENTQYGPPAPTPELKERRILQLDELVESGTPVASKARLRTLPVWTTVAGTDIYPFVQIRGGTQVQLAAAVSVAEAAALRNNRDLETLARDQISWLLGRNPFSQSLMYGEGYDYQHHWSAMFDNLVGSIPVGIDSRESDKPFWPAANHMTYKEQWGLASGKFLWAMSWLSSPAHIYGSAKANGSFTDKAGRVTRFQRGKLSLSLPPGEYELSCGPIKRQINLVGGTKRRLEVNPERYIEMTGKLSQDGEQVVLSATTTGLGSHKVALRLFNLAGEKLIKSIDLSSGVTEQLQWSLQLKEANTPWVALAVADDDLDRSLEFV